MLYLHRNVRTNAVAATKISQVEKPGIHRNPALGIGICTG
jgi:hypothetical protein